MGPQGIASSNQSHHRYRPQAKNVSLYRVVIRSVKRFVSDEETIGGNCCCCCCVCYNTAAVKMIDRPYPNPNPTACTNYLVSEDHVTVVVLVDGLRKDSHKGNHRQSSVIDFLVLVVNPSLIGVVDPVGGSQNITGDVSGAVLDFLGKPFNGTTSEDELEPSDSGELLCGLEGVVGKGRVEGGVNSGGVEVPSEAGGHGDTSVLEFGLTVCVHCGIVLALGKTQGVEVSHGRGDSDDVLVPPGGKGCLRCLRLLGRSKGGAVHQNKTRNETKRNETKQRKGENKFSDEMIDRKQSNKQAPRSRTNTIVSASRMFIRNEAQFLHRA